MRDKKCVECGTTDGYSVLLGRKRCATCQLAFYHRIRRDEGFDAVVREARATHDAGVRAARRNA